MTGAELLLNEIREQPAVWRARAGAHEDIARLGQELAQEPPTLVRIVGHGTSDHAAMYASYVLRLTAGWTVLRDSMSAVLAYGARAAAPGELAIGISQSGATPDVVAWLEACGRAGARTVAITNDPRSPLARSAQTTLALEVGPERSVAATKTYTGTLAILALLGGHAAGRGARFAGALQAAAGAAEEAMPGLEAGAQALAEADPSLDKLYVVGRGFELATANEIALKLTEIAYVAGRALSATSLAHGPVAAMDAGFPLWVVADEATLPALAEASERAHAAGAPVVITGPVAAKVDGDRRLPTPAPREPLLAPLLSVLGGQLYARALALAKGLDPGHPRNITKVTEAA